MAGEYTEENIKTLAWQEHIRARAGMYIGKLGDGTMASADSLRRIAPQHFHA